MGSMEFCIFSSGLESVPNLVLAKDWEKEPMQKNNLQSDRDVLFAFGVLFEDIDLWNWNQNLL